MQTESPAADERCRRTISGGGAQKPTKPPGKIPAPVSRAMRATSRTGVQTVRSLLDNTMWR